MTRDNLTIYKLDILTLAETSCNSVLATIESTVLDSHIVCIANCAISAIHLDEVDFNIICSREVNILDKNCLCLIHACVTIDSDSTSVVVIVTIDNVVLASNLVNSYITLDISIEEDSLTILVCVECLLKLTS